MNLPELINAFDGDEIKEYLTQVTKACEAEINQLIDEMSDNVLSSEGVDADLYATESGLAIGNLLGLSFELMKLKLALAMALKADTDEEIDAVKVALASLSRVS